MKKFTDLYATLSKIVQTHTDKPNPVILDLGCGPGLLSIEIQKQIPDSMVVGIDPLMKMLVLANKNMEESGVRVFNPIRGISEKIALKNESIDTIVSRFSLPYWKFPQQSFSEMHRVLKPGGKIIFEALNKEFPRWRLFCIKIGMLLKRSGRDVSKYHVDAYDLAHTQEEVEMFFKKAGFTILQKEGKKNEWKFLVIAKKKIDIR